MSKAHKRRLYFWTRWQRWKKPWRLVRPLWELD